MVAHISKLDNFDSSKHVALITAPYFTTFMYNYERQMSLASIGMKTTCSTVTAIVSNTPACTGGRRITAAASSTGILALAPRWLSERALEVRRGLG